MSWQSEKENRRSFQRALGQEDSNSEFPTDEMQVEELDTGRPSYSVDPNINPMFRKKARIATVERTSQLNANGVRERNSTSEFSSAHQCGHMAFTADFLQDSENFRPQSPSPTISPKSRCNGNSQHTREWMDTNLNYNQEKESKKRKLF